MEGQRDPRRDPPPTGVLTPESDPRLQRAYDREARAAYEEPEVVSAFEARQGTRGRPLLYALVIGLVLAGLLVLGLQFWTVQEDVPTTAQIEEPVIVPDTPPIAGPGDEPAAPVIR
jgi:hypothetical protein